VISGVVICFNEADRIERCLKSLAFCDEIVVVDSCSTDGTQDVVRKYTDRLIEQPFLGYVKQKNFALDQARNDWVVCLDADEALSPELAANVRGAIARNDGRVSGYWLDRVTWYLGVWHDRGEWYPDWQLRVFRRSRGRWGGLDPHDRVELEGPVEKLPGRLLHWNYRHLSDHIQTLDRFSARMARSLMDSGVRFRTWDMVMRPPARFVKSYFLRLGLLKGRAGFIVSIAGAYYVFMKYAKLWELEQTRANPPAHQ
jgi:glycosyltransferase involved in cell wall biosynthesis